MKATILLSALSALVMSSFVTAQDGKVPYVGYEYDGQITHCKMPGVVAFTIDDGPAQYNDQLLALLARKNVKATFFMVGSKVAEFPQAAKKIYDAGHQLASHTYTHANLDATNANYAAEMDKTKDLIFKQVGVKVTYMRPPEGNCFTKSCQDAMKARNYTVAHWNLDSKDWLIGGKIGKEYKDATAALSDVMEVMIKPNITRTDIKQHSLIYLQHELLDFSVNYVAESVIDAIAGMGYRFVTMEECLGIAAYEGFPDPQPPTIPSPAPAPGTGNPAPAPGSGTPSANPPKPSGSATSPQTSVSEKPKSSASIKQLGAWAMGAAALASYLLL
ncbi:hypothetical protein BGZ73_001282 [Actinomortierella ambigua]|nr:hypothetical protein BGZ73_001282 [Actinomortierella ambigua]